MRPNVFTPQQQIFCLQLSPQVEKVNVSNDGKLLLHQHVNFAKLIVCYYAHCNALLLLCVYLTQSKKKKEKSSALMVWWV